MASSPSIPSITSEQMCVLKSTLNAFKPFTSLRATMPMQYVTTFLAVAADEGQNVTTYAKRVGISQSLMTRHLSDLGAINRNHGEGFGLIDGAPDLMDRRNRLMRLSAKGKNVVNEICEAFASLGREPPLVIRPVAVDLQL
jgi:DNA-binding MarR family transcriptional regulator